MTLSLTVAAYAAAALRKPDGITNNGIAKTLFISSTTVDTHRKNLLTKFEVKNTASLIRMEAHAKII